MALVSIIFTVRDAKGASSRLEFPYDFPDDLLNAENGFSVIPGRALALGVNLAAMITGEITGVTANVRIPVQSGWNEFKPETTSDVEEGARFTWDTVNGYVATNRVPTFDEDLFIPATRTVDIAAIPVANFITLNTLPVTVGLEQYQRTDTRLDPVDRLRNAVEDFQKSRRG